MSELRSTIEQLAAERLPELPDARIEEDFAELQRACELLDLERLRRLAAIDRRRLHERDGHLSMASWLARTHHLSHGAAQSAMKLATALEEMPETRRALEDGDISMSAVRILVDARDAEPETFAASESDLVDAARRHSISDLQKLTAFWRQRCRSRARS